MSQQVRRQRRSAPLVEQLESRQLLHATVDVRPVGGGDDNITVTTVGQVVNFEVWVRVEGHDGINNEGLQIITGAFLSKNLSGGAAGGNLTVTRLSPFNGPGSSDGTQFDADSDGDLDISGPDGQFGDGFFAARSGGLETDGTRDGQAEEFKVATGSFTVTSLLGGVSTDLTFAPRTNAPAGAFTYQEDGSPKNNSNGTLVAGDVITLQRPPTSTIKGRVFDDRNATGFFDGDDVGIDGFRVFLDADFDGVLDAGETSKPVSSTGTYTFSNLPAGRYQVREVFRSGWRQSFPAEGFYDFTLGFGETGKSLSFANTQGVLIKGLVWHDSNPDRVKQPEEDVMPGWRVIIDLNTSGVWDEGDISKATDSRGRYRFSLLTSGEFTIMIRQLPGYRQTTNGGFPRVVTLGPGETTSNKNFGVKRLKTT